MYTASSGACSSTEAGNKWRWVSLRYTYLGILLQGWSWDAWHIHACTCGSSLSPNALYLLSLLLRLETSLEGQHECVLWIHSGSMHKGLLLKCLALESACEDLINVDQRAKQVNKFTFHQICIPFLHIFIPFPKYLWSKLQLMQFFTVFWFFEFLVLFLDFIVSAKNMKVTKNDNTFQAWSIFKQQFQKLIRHLI